MKSKSFRNQQRFLRNSFDGEGRWGIPIVKKQVVDLTNQRFISFNSTRNNEAPMLRDFAVHFFVDDNRFEIVYNQPERNLDKLRQYKLLLTPDFSQYAEMQPWRRIESTGKSRWCGAYWKHEGMIVIPTISWSTPRSYEFCFDGVEKNSIIAIGMIIEYLIEKIPVNATIQALISIICLPLFMISISCIIGLNNKEKNIIKEIVKAKFKTKK